MLVGEVAVICEGIICKTCVEMDIQVIEIGVANISGLRAVSMGRLGMVWMSWKSIFASKISVQRGHLLGVSFLESSFLTIQ